MAHVISFRVPAGTHHSSAIPQFTAVSGYVVRILRSLEIVSGEGSARLVVGRSELPWFDHHDGPIDTYIAPTIFHAVMLEAQAMPNADMVIHVTLETIEPISTLQAIPASYGGYPVCCAAGMFSAPAPESLYRLRYLNLEAITADIAARILQ